MRTSERKVITLFENCILFVHNSIWMVRECEPRLATLGRGEERQHEKLPTELQQERESVSCYIQRGSEYVIDPLDILEPLMRT